MLLVSPLSFTVSKKIDGAVKVFVFEPDKPVEVPDNIAVDLLTNPYTEKRVSQAEENKKDSAAIEKIKLKVIEDPPQKKEDTPIFTKKQLDDYKHFELVKIAKEIGLKTFGKKSTSLVKEILKTVEAPPNIE